MYAEIASCEVVKDRWIVSSAIDDENKVAVDLRTAADAVIGNGGGYCIYAAGS